jgi:DMSO/TMAO reductase YedYZ molybdopterin-dependent catalytic subunit
VTPFLTAPRDFYRIDTALSVPRLDASRWRLRLHGMVERELELSFRDLLALPLLQRTITLTCVSNEVGGTLAGNAQWLGVPVRTLLERAGVRAGADMVLSRSSDGFTASTPLAALTDGRDALLAVGMNGAPLPYEHGFPVRMVVPGLYGYVSATKWLVDLEVTRFDRQQAYWTERGWAPQAPIRTFSRIDVPRPFAHVPAGRVAVGGVAWAQRRGIRSVQVRVDGGEWQDARLAGVPSVDTWRQWAWTWDADPGLHRLEVRSSDALGDAQPEIRRPPKPDGATGWHSVTVTVT